MEFSGTRGIEQRMYKEQETLKLRTHQEIQEAYCAQCAKLATYDAVFFPARVSTTVCRVSGVVVWGLGESSC